MRSLEKLQHDFQNYLLQDDPAMLSSVAEVPPLSPEERLDLYAEAYLLRLFDVLKADYPALFVLMGEDAFIDLFREYVDSFPSQHRSVRWFGKCLAEFLRNTLPYSEQLFLQELAQFEWALNQAFDAENTQIVTLADMATVDAQDWASMHFVLTPTFQKLTFFGNIVEIWGEAKEGGLQSSPQLSKDPVTWLIWRKAYDVQFCSMTPEEIYMIDGMQQGLNFSELCEGLCEWMPPEEAALQAGYLLKKFIMDELVSEIKLVI